MYREPEESKLHPSSKQLPKTVPRDAYVNNEPELHKKLEVFFFSLLTILFFGTRFMKERSKLSNLIKNLFVVINCIDTISFYATEI